MNTVEPTPTLPPLRIGAAVIAADGSTIMQSGETYHYHTPRRRAVICALAQAALDGMPWLSQDAIQNRLQLTAEFRMDRVFADELKTGNVLVKCHRVYALRAAVKQPVNSQ